MEIRHDRAELKTPRRVGSSMVFEGVIARVHGPGDGLEYPDHTEYRDIAGLKLIARQATGIPVIVMHPPKDKKRGLSGRVAPALAAGLTKIVGRVKSVRLDGNEAIASFEITDPEGVEAIQDGFRELSLGYGVDRLDMAGFQRGFDVDHLAIVRNARCGAACSIRTDCDEEKACACQRAERMQHSDPNPKGKTMANKTPHDQSEALRSLETQRADADARALAASTEAEAEKLRADTAEGRLIELENRIKELEAQISANAVVLETEAIKTEKLRADTAEEKVRQFDSTYEKRLRQRVALERKAWVVMGPEFRMDDLSDREIESTVVKHLDSNADVTAAVADGVIHGRFLALTERHDASARSLARVAEITATTTRHDAAEEAKAKAKKTWMEPLPNSRHTRANNR